jgi:hypothetical protein
MNTLRTLKKLLFGETWLLPVGIATILIAAGLLRHVAPASWPHLGGAFLAAGIVLVLVSSVTRSTRKR